MLEAPIKYISSVFCKATGFAGKFEILYRYSLLMLSSRKEVYFVHMNKE